MKKTGSLLKSKRESANLSISEVALATKINPKVLTAIENGDEKSLPAKTILKGFVKSYALFLKMDVEEVMKTFQEECGGPKPQMHHPVEQTRNESSSSRRRVNDENSSGMRTVAVVVIVILIGMIIGVRELIEKYQREKVVESPLALKATPVETSKTEVTAVTENHADDHQEDAAKADEKAPEPKVEEKKVEVVKTETKPAEVEKPAEPEKPFEPVKVEPTHTETKPVVAEEKYPPFKPELKPIVIPTSIFPNLVELRPTKEAKPAEPAKPAEAAKPAEQAKPVEVAKTPEPTKAPEPTEPAKPSNKPDSTSAAVTPSSPLKAMKNEIILEALDKVEVKFQVGGETKRVSLGPQEVHTIRADEPLTLDLSDGGAVNIILNGRDRGPAGDLGKPKTLKIP